MKVNLTVTKATSSSNGGFVVTLKEVKDSKVVDTAFGKQKSSEYGDTYYMKLEDAPQVGFSAEINLDDYNIVERPFTTDNDKDIDMKWLHIR